MPDVFNGKINMSMIFYNIIKYLIEIIKLFLTGTFLFGIKTKSRKYTLMVIFISVALTAAVSFFYNISKIGIIYGLIGILSFEISAVNKKKIGLLVLSYTSVCILDMFISGIAFFCLNKNMDRVMNNKIYNLLLNSFSIILILLIIILKQKFGREKIHENYSPGYVIFAIIGEIALGIYITSIQMFSFDGKSSTERLAALALSISGIVFMIVCSCIISVQGKYRALKKESEITSKLLKLQEEYYTTLLSKEEDTKKFRHDIRTHLYSLQTLIKNKEYQNAENYLSKLNADFEELYITYSVGNKLVDVILNDIYSRHKNVKFNLNGSINSKIIISQMDMCTIFSNLLSNAFEAAERCEDKKVDMNIKILGSNLFINIVNTSLPPIKIDKNEFLSSKSGSWHGYGLKNVKSCLEKYNGNFESSYDGQFFTTEIIIPNALSVQ